MLLAAAALVPSFTGNRVKNGGAGREECSDLC